MGIRAGLLATFATCVVLVFACSKKNGAKTDAGGDAIGDDALNGPDAALCHQFGDTCAGNADC